MGQHDTSGETLERFAVNGSSFAKITGKLLEKFSPRIKGRAVKPDGTWSVKVPAMRE